MYYFKRILKTISILYLIYILFFSIFIFSYHKSINKKDIEEKLAKPLGENIKNDRIALIESPEDAINVRLDLIENAHSSIDISYYKLVDGEVADLFLGSVLEAADRGVQVRILLDGIIQLSNLGGKVNKIFLGFENHPNISLKLYEPFNPLLPISWNNRLHDKLILVDKEFALTGGRNIEDRFYLEEVFQEGFVKDRELLVYNHEKKDTAVEEKEVPSSVIENIQSYYDELWNHSYSKAKYRYMSKRRISKGEAYLARLRLEHETFKNDFLDRYFPSIKAIDWREETIPADRVRFISNPIGRSNQDPRILKAILQLSSEVQNDMLIQSPYIVPSRSISAAYREYDIDPKKIRLLTNSCASSPNLPAFAGYKRYREDMVDQGLTIYEYQGPGSIHAKTAIFDKYISLIGTFNIDPRSAYLSTESVVIVESEEFTQTLKETMQKNLYYSLEVDENYEYIELEGLPAYDINRAKRIFITALSKITPLFEYLL